MQVKLTKISYTGALFQYQFKQDSGLFKAWFRQVSLYYLMTTSTNIYGDSSPICTLETSCAPSTINKAVIAWLLESTHPP